MNAIHWCKVIYPGIELMNKNGSWSMRTSVKPISSSLIPVDVQLSIQLTWSAGLSDQGWQNRLLHFVGFHGESPLSARKFLRWLGHGKIEFDQFLNQCPLAKCATKSQVIYSVSNLFLSTELMWVFLSQPIELFSQSFSLSM